MSINSHLIPVPTFGTGPIVDVSDLVGSTSVVLTGQLIGNYILLAGHDPTSLVPIARLNADGQSEITNLEALAYKYAAVRVEGNVQPSISAAVVMSGISSLGENHFGTIAVLSDMNVGVQPSIDTYAMFPPTGLETEVNLICRGSFEGAIIVEGSTDGSEWSPVTSFQTSIANSPYPLIAPFEFEPVKTLAKVRYLRVNVRGRVLGPTSVTIGGRIPTGGGGSPTGPAGGELTGTYPNPSLSAPAVQAQALAVCVPTTRTVNGLVLNNNITLSGENVACWKFLGETTFSGFTTFKALLASDGSPILWDQSYEYKFSLYLSGSGQGLTPIGIRLQVGTVDLGSVTWWQIVGGEPTGTWIQGFGSFPTTPGHQGGLLFGEHGAEPIYYQANLSGNVGNSVGGSWYHWHSERSQQDNESMDGVVPLCIGATNGEDIDSNPMANKPFRIVSNHSMGEGAIRVWRRLFSAP